MKKLTFLELEQEMLKIALKNMTAYQTDIIYDFDTLNFTFYRFDEHYTSQKFLWSLRDTGTDLTVFPCSEGEYKLIHSPNPHKYIITVALGSECTIEEYDK